MTTIKSIRKKIRKTFIKPWVREPSKIRQTQALKEMTGNFKLQKKKKKQKTLYVWTGEDTKNKVRNKWPIGKTFTTHMKDKVLQFLLYKKVCTNCHEKKKKIISSTEKWAKDMNRQFQEEETQKVNKHIKTAYQLYWPGKFQ